MKRLFVLILRVLWFVITAPFVLVFEGLSGAAEMSGIERSKA